jgi:MYXO-CTERM domain-containing protein
MGMLDRTLARLSGRENESHMAFKYHNNTMKFHLVSSMKGTLMTQRFVSDRGTRVRLGSISLALALLGICSFAQQADAQLTYVEAVDQLSPGSQNIFSNTGGPITETTHLDPNASANGEVPDNNLWNYRDEGVPFGGFSTIYESIGENSPELQVRITSGLTPGSSYDIYVAHWSPDVVDYGVRAGFASNPGANPILNRGGGNGGTAGSFGGSGVWTTLPDDNPESTVDVPSPFVNVSDVGGTIVPPALPRTDRMYLNLVGTTTADANGDVFVYVDDIGTEDFNQRSWLDGLAFAPAGDVVFTNSTINRDTGALTFNNPTDTPLNIVSYSVTSAAGSLNQTQWTEIAPAGGWTVTSPSGTSVLSLAENGPASTIAASGGSLQLGNVFNRTPFQDIQLSLTLSSGQVIEVTPTYSGAALAAGDFDGDGDLTLADFEVLRSNMFNPGLGSLTLVGAYLSGDLSQDRKVNATDFLAFRSAYDAANGVGSFASMLQTASVPEPTSGLLGLLGLGFFTFHRGRRATARVTTNHDCVTANPEMATMNKSHAKLRASTLATTLLAVAFAANTVSAQTTPVTGWFSSGTGAVTAGQATNSPTIGNGTANNADNTTVWAALPTPIVLANGEEVVLTGTTQLISVGPGGGDSIRFGLFNGNNWFVPGTNETYDGLADEAFNAGTVPAAWSGFLAQCSSFGANALFDAKNPSFTGFNNNNFASTFGVTTGLPGVPGVTPFTPGDPNTAAKNIRLAAGPPSQGGVTDGTYNFEVRVGRFGDENTMSVRLVSQDTQALAGDFDADSDVDGRDFMAWQRNPAVGNLADWQANYGQSGGGAPRYLLNLTATASPLQDTLPSFIPTEFDRVGILLSGSMDTDQAIFSNVNITKTAIQTLLLDVNTSTGAMSVRNGSGNPFNITYYEVTSANGNLDHVADPNGWVSLDDGEGGDPAGTGWDEIGFPSANVIGELNLEGSRTMANGASFSIGKAFNTATAPGSRDISFFFATEDGVLRRGLVNYNTTSTLAAVPEPATLSLIAGIGLLALGRRRSAVC